MDGGAWKAAVHGVAEGRTWLSDFTFTFHFPALEKEMATHSSVLAWRIPGMGEPGGLPSKGSHRVGHDWRDLAAAAAAAWRRTWQPTLVFLPGESRGQRSLVGYSLWGCKESDMTEWLTLSLSESDHLLLAASWVMVRENSIVSYIFLFWKLRRLSWLLLDFMLLLFLTQQPQPTWLV